MPKNLHTSDWMVINQADEKIVEIDVTGIIGGSFWFDEAGKEVNTKEKMRAELKAIAELNATKIIVNIDSPGGSVFHGLSIHDLLAQHPAEKEVRIIGVAASIATVIAQAGNTRKMSDNALFLVHHSMSGVMGNVKEQEALIDDLKKYDEKIISIYKKRGADPEKVDALMEENNGNGKWIFAEEAKEAGFIDEVFEPTKAAAVIDENIINKLNYPAMPKTEKAKDTRSFFDKMKEAFAMAFKKEEGADPVVPQEVTDKISEFDTKLSELENENENLSTEAEALKADATAKDATIATLNRQIEEKETAHAAALAEKETEINKLKAESTKPKAKAGLEGADEGIVLDAYKESLKADAAKITKLTSEIRSEDITDN